MVPLTDEQRRRVEELDRGNIVKKFLRFPRIKLMRSFYEAFRNDIDDAEQTCRMALMNAVRAYDGPEDGFEAYAFSAMYRELLGKASSNFCIQRPPGATNGFYTPVESGSFGSDEAVDTFDHREDPEVADMKSTAKLTAMEILCGRELEVMLRLLDGEFIEQIATSMGVSYQVARKLRRSAIHALRTKLVT